MRNIHRLNVLLWVVNTLVGAGIVVFAFHYLVFPQDAGYLEGFDPGQIAVAPISGPAAQTQSDDVLKTLRNPIEKRKGQGEGGVSSSFRAKLKGVFLSPHPKLGVAFIQSQGRSTEMVAFVEEPICFEGRPYDEFAGWTLRSVTKDAATFSNGTLKATLPLEHASKGAFAAPHAVAPRVVANLAGQSYAPQNYKTQILSQSEDRSVWGLDRAEVQWAMQNAERILDQEIQVTPHGGGGVRIENVVPGSIAAERGLMAGDVVRNVNGIPLQSIADARNLLNNPQLRNQAVLVLNVERAGKVVALEYRPLPR